eukprot:gene14428-20434_t
MVAREMRLLLRATLLLIILEFVSGSSAEAAFLSGELSLQPLFSTPVELLSVDNSTVLLGGNQALTVVFSRPVIALGSDFRNELGHKVPFSLSCAHVLGRYRWVTTTIFRFDTNEEWPTDLKCYLEWNKTLTTYDGVPIDLGNIPERRQLGSDALTMTVSSVLSEMADNATDGMWSGTTGPRSHALPEIPPDGRIILSFSYRVNVSMLQTNLSLFLASDNSIEVPITVSATTCYSPVPWLARSSGPPGPKAPAVNMCVEVTLLQPLEVATGYVLKLPKGAKYNHVSGPLQEDLTLRVFGLRPFVIPFKTDYRGPTDENDAVYGPRYRRLDLWLPHGLTSHVDELGAQIRVSLFEGDGASGEVLTSVEIPFDISLQGKAIARLVLPTLEPRQSIMVQVEASDNVTDGFGLPLGGSSTTFWMSDNQALFQGPETQNQTLMFEVMDLGCSLHWPYIAAGSSWNHNSVNNPGVTSASFFSNYRSQTLLFEVMDQGSILHWPHIAAGSSWNQNSENNPGVTSASSWTLKLDTNADMIQLISLTRSLYRGAYVPDVLGPPELTVTRPPNSLPGDGVNLSLPLGPITSPSVHLVHTCCSSYGWPPQIGSADVKIVMKSSISAAIASSSASLLAWVTDATIGGGGWPIQGAVVSAFVIKRDPEGLSLFSAFVINRDPVSFLTWVTDVSLGGEPVQGAVVSDFVINRDQEEEGLPRGLYCHPFLSTGTRDPVSLIAWVTYAYLRGGPVQGAVVSAFVINRDQTSNANAPGELSLTLAAPTSPDPLASKD